MVCSVQFSSVQFRWFYFLFSPNNLSSDQLKTNYTKHVLVCKYINITEELTLYYNLDFVLMSLFGIGPVIATQLNLMHLYYSNPCFVKHKPHLYNQILKAAFISDNKSIKISHKSQPLTQPLKTALTTETFCQFL